MKNLFVLFTFLASSSFGQTLTCTESCQYWDDFDRVCDYATRCEVSPGLLRYRYCDRFDSFERKCISESTKVSPHKINPYAALPSCTESCQYFDDFTGQCMYRTKCEYSSSILKHTECEKWDSFDQKCNFSASTYSWNVY